MTPHPGEAARLLGDSTQDISRDRFAALSRLAEKYTATVVLKGAGTLVQSSRDVPAVCGGGNPAMASGGMGDVLTGMIAGLVAQKCTAAEAACAGVYLHGLAADILARETPWGYLATDVMEAVPYAIEEIMSNPPPLPVGVPIL